MVSEAQPAKEVELDGKKYKVQFDFNALCALESVTGGNALSGEIFKTINASNVRALFFAGLRTYHPNLDLEATGQLLKPTNVGAVIAAVQEAFIAAFGSEKKTETASE